MSGPRQITASRALTDAERAQVERMMRLSGVLVASDFADDNARLRAALSPSAQEARDAE